MNKFSLAGVVVVAGALCALVGPCASGQSVAPAVGPATYKAATYGAGLDGAGTYGAGTNGAGLDGAGTDGAGPYDALIMPGQADRLEARWPAAPTASGSRELLVVTVARPKSRQHCRLPSLTPEELVCGGTSGKRTTFPRSDVVALIVPRQPREWGGVIGASLVLAGGGGIIYGAVALAAVSVVGAVPLAVVGGLVALLGLVGEGFAVEDRGSESLLYLLPGATLQVKLRS